MRLCYRVPRYHGWYVLEKDARRAGWKPGKHVSAKALERLGIKPSGSVAGLWQRLQHLKEKQIKEERL